MFVGLIVLLNLLLISVNMGLDGERELEFKHGSATIVLTLINDVVVIKAFAVPPTSHTSF